MGRSSTVKNHTSEMVLFVGVMEWENDPRSNSTITSGKFSEFEPENKPNSEWKHVETHLKKP